MCLYIYIDVRYSVSWDARMQLSSRLVGPGGCLCAAIANLALRRISK